VPLRQTRVELGFTDAEISNMEDDDAKARIQELADMKASTAVQSAGAPPPAPGLGPPLPANPND